MTGKNALIETRQPEGIPRIGALDGLRGAAAIAVVGYHYLLHGPQMYGDRIGGQVGAAIVGREGVRLFFMISGFVIAMSLRRSAIRSFGTSRLIRLYPTYWLGLVLTSTTLVIFGLPGRHLSGAQFAANLSMIQGYLGAPHIDGAYWTLEVELVFYIICAALWFAGLLTSHRLSVTLHVWLVILLAAVLLIPSGQEAWRELVENLPWFITGIAALAIVEGDRRPSTLLLPAAAVAVVSVSNARVAIFGLVLYGVFLAVLMWRSFGFASRPMQFLGDISYPLYLIHQNIGYVLLIRFRLLGLGRTPSVAITAIVMVLLATLITFLYDQPIRRILRRRLMPRNQATAR